MALIPRWWNLAAVVAAGLLVSAAALALGLPRGTLWRVEQVCVLNSKLTGFTFPCAKVEVNAGYAILREPLSTGRIVVMPTERIVGVEDAKLQLPTAPDILQGAWSARRYIDDFKDDLPWNSFALAINSKITRSQDQLHIHVDCVDPAVVRELSDPHIQIVPDAWRRLPFPFHGQSYFARRIEGQSLQGVNPFRLAAESPYLRDRPDLLVLAVIGITDADGQNGFILLAGQSNPKWPAFQPTSEALLERTCMGS